MRREGSIVSICLYRDPCRSLRAVREQRMRRIAARQYLAATAPPSAPIVLIGTPEIDDLIGGGSDEIPIFLRSQSLGRKEAGASSIKGEGIEVSRAMITAGASVAVATVAALLVYSFGRAMRSPLRRWRRRRHRRKTALPQSWHGVIRFPF
jgi:hypothetical protein